MKLIEFFSYYNYKILKSRKTFKFRGKKYKYFYHRYNKTWKNERMVEIPIVWDMVKKNIGKGILEIGNVLSHYFSFDHEIVDKYEKVEGVINQDVVNFKSTKKYDLIVSISTLEHVGWKETPKDPTKILRAIKNLKNILTSNGKIVVTLPLGYNTDMDRLLKSGKLKFTKMYFMKRIFNDEWAEVGWRDIENAKYNDPYPCANGLIFGILEGKI